jgi:hypothetical protein
MTDEHDRNMAAYSLARRLLKGGLLAEAEIVTRLVDAWAVDQSECLAELGAGFWNRGERERGLALLDEALAVARTAEHELGVADGLTTAADVLVGLGLTDRARPALRQASALALHVQESENIQDAVDGAKILRQIATLLGRIGDAEESARVDRAARYPRR